MMVTIGHASASETGSGNGVKGDQTGREVCTRSWYAHPATWSYCLRPSPYVAEKSAAACEAAIKNSAIGYGKDTRNTLHIEAQKVGYDLAKIKTPCNCDCSSFMTVCAIAGGAVKLEYTGNAPTTRTMVEAFKAAGYDVLTDKQHLTMQAYLNRGDILVAPGHHTVMVLSDGVEAWLDGTETPAEHIDQRGVDLVKSFEGCKLKAYRLPGETIWSIGYGHQAHDIVENMTISQERADELLRIDLALYEGYVKRIVKDITLTQGRLNALTSYCYNRGPGKLERDLAANCHTVQEYADGIVKYWGSKERYKKALLRRREAERQMFLS